MYNTTNITNANDYYQMYVAVNQLSNSLFAGFTIFVIFFILLVVFKGRYEFKEVLLGDSFICTIIGIIMLWLGLINMTILIFPILLFFGMLIYNLFA